MGRGSSSNVEYTGLGVTAFRESPHERGELPGAGRLDNGVPAGACLSRGKDAVTRSSGAAIQSAAPSLERFATIAAASEGVSLRLLAPIAQLEVRTRNSTYHITLLGTGRVMVLGGAFFPVWSEANLCGSTLGGSMLKTDWVGCGFSMEFLHRGVRIVTTRVRAIRIVDACPTVS